MKHFFVTAGLWSVPGAVGVAVASVATIGLAVSYYITAVSCLIQCV